MKKILIIISMLAMIMSFAGCSEKKEDVNTSASKEQKEQNNENDQNKEADKLTAESRIAVGTNSLTEIINELGIKMLGIPTTTHERKEELKKIDTIGSPMNPDIEKLKSLKLDFFISDDVLKNSLQEKLKNQDIKTLFYKTSKYDDVKNTIKSLADTFGKQEKGNKLIKDMEAIEEKIKKETKDKEKITVLAIFGTPESFMMCTKHSYVGDLVNKAGAINITDSLESAKGPYVPFSIENIVKANPDVILRMTHANPEQSRKMFDKEFNNNKVWQSLDAVKNNRVYDLDNKYFGVVANIRCGKALEKMFEMIHK
ncbi:helical backbone metal receptor [Clostridiaceae bacterium M8S5]|nr:helical backbone metal receptor [Clostridiaceae bacterium M8S5]